MTGRVVHYAPGEAHVRPTRDPGASWDVFVTPCFSRVSHEHGFAADPAAVEPGSVVVNCGVCMAARDVPARDLHVYVFRNGRVVSVDGMEVLACAFS